MKKLLSILVSIILCILFFTSYSYSNDIDWFFNYDEALEAAQQNNKNIFILITAPTWCYWCGQFEEKVLRDKEVIKLLNSEFIPLVVTDTIDEKGQPILDKSYSGKSNKNPELENFNFYGYPSVFLYSKDGEMLKNVYVLDPDLIITKLNKYVNGLVPEPYSGNYYFENGFYSKEKDNKWVKNENDEITSYYEIDSDSDYIYIYNEEDEYVIAIPIDGGMAYIKMDDTNEWEELYDIYIDS